MLDHFARSWFKRDHFIKYVFTRHILIGFMSTLFILIPCSGMAAEHYPTNGQYVGAGLSHFLIQSNHPSIGSQSVTGIEVVYGIWSKQHLFEISAGGGSGVNTGPTPDIFYPGDSADLMSLAITYQYHFLNLTQTVMPYVGLGYSINSINWNTYVYDLTGEGLTMLAGVRIPLNRDWRVNFSYRHNRYSGSRIIFSSGGYPDYDTTIKETAMVLEYLF